MYDELIKANAMYIGSKDLTNNKFNSEVTRIKSYKVVYSRQI